MSARHRRGRLSRGEHIESSPADCCGERQRAEAVFAARRKPDHDGWPSGIASGRVEGGRQSTMHRVASRMLARHVDLASRPALAESFERREQPALNDVLEGPEREAAVEALLDPCCVHSHG
jgi:hypothetical protein